MSIEKKSNIGSLFMINWMCKISQRNVNSLYWNRKNLFSKINSLRLRITWKLKTSNYTNYKGLLTSWNKTTNYTKPT